MPSGPRGNSADRRIRSAVRDVHPRRDVARPQLAANHGPDAEELLDRYRAAGQEQRLAEPSVMGGHRPCTAALGGSVPQAEDGAAGRLTTGMRLRGLDDGARDEPDVDAGVHQRVGVRG